MHLKVWVASALTCALPTYIYNALPRYYEAAIVEPDVFGCFRRVLGPLISEGPLRVLGLQFKFQLNHNSWHNLIVHHKLTYEDLDMMLNTYHDSDSAKDFNPIYYIVNRNVNNTHKTKEIFDKYNF